MIKDELRIPFLDTWSAREADRKTFGDYHEGIITARTGAYLVGLHNKIEVSVEQFLANVDWLGYRKDGYERNEHD